MNPKTPSHSLVDQTDRIRELLLQQKQFLEHLEKTLKRSRQTFIPGRLRVSHGRYYYITEKHDTSGRYLNRSKHSFAAKLAQQEYRQMLLKAVQKDLKALDRALALLPASIHRIYSSLPEARQNLITPYLLPDDLFLESWLHEPFDQKPSGIEVPKYVTEKGEHVRSKSEKIIADKLFLLGIPYRYEAALLLSGRDPLQPDIRIHPDFTLLDIKTRKEVYWEHLGMMDDPDYAIRALQRLSLYAENGILPGQGLILTFETSQQPFGGQELDDLLRPFSRS